MISDRGMSTLRVAATLCHFLPGTGVRVKHGDEVVLAVAPVPHGPCAGHGAPSGPNEETCSHGWSMPVRIGAGAFRNAVGRAHSQRQSGQALRFLDLAPGCEPNADIYLPDPAASLLGGIYGVPLPGRWLWATATTLASQVAYELGLEPVSDALPIEGLHAMGIRPDPLTDVCVAYVETHAGPGSPGEAAVVDLLESMLARWAAHELVLSVEAPAGSQISGN